MFDLFPGSHLFIFVDGAFKSSLYMSSFSCGIRVFLFKHVSDDVYVLWMVLEGTDI